MRTVPLLLVLLTMESAAHAEDGYCDFAEGVAEAESAVLFAPSVFGQFGRIEQTAVQPDTSGELRVIGGMRWRLTGIYEGVATKKRASAQCKRHVALEQIRGATLYRALEARAKVIDGSLVEATQLAERLTADLEANRTTIQDATATRLRIDELRRISADTHREMSLLPQTTGAPGLVAFQAADDDIERQDGKLRRAKGLDVSVRAGVDQLVDQPRSSPWFAVVAVDVNLGVLFQGGGNHRAADGRRRYLRSGRDPLTVDATSDRMMALVDAANRRAKETALLEADLAHEMATLETGGGDARRYRQILWFEWVKTRAERAYHEAHGAALQQILRGH